MHRTTQVDGAEFGEDGKKSVTKQQASASGGDSVSIKAESLERVCNYCYLESPPLKQLILLLKLGLEKQKPHFPTNHGLLFVGINHTHPGDR